MTGIEFASRTILGVGVALIAALGVKTSFKKLATVGWKPIALMVAETVFLAAGFVSLKRRFPSPLPG